MAEYKYRVYECSDCGHEDEIQTNHEGTVLHYCKGCSWKPSGGTAYAIPALDNRVYRKFIFAEEEKTDA